MTRLGRRGFLASLGALGAAATLPRRARAEVDGEIAHPVEPPPALEFRTWHFDRTPMYGGPSTAIVAVPRGLSPGERLPLLVMLPGGHHNMQRHDQGCWGWWSEYHLGEIDTALRRGTLTPRDFYDFGRPDEIDHTNRMLGETPYRGMVIVTPWVVGRQLQPEPHGMMVAKFLHHIVARARAELPVLDTREATGLGGMSSGGLHTIFAGSVASELFSTLVATQPFTEDLVPPLRKIVTERAQKGTPQRLRMVTSVDDHQKPTTLELASALRKDGVPLELHVYRGAHSAQFAAGPGGIDALFTFDRALRGEDEDGSRPLPPRDGLLSSIEMADDRRRDAAGAAQPRAWTRGETLATWGAVATAGAAFGLVSTRARRT